MREVCCTSFKGFVICVGLSKNRCCERVPIADPLAVCWSILWRACYESCGNGTAMHALICIYVYAYCFFGEPNELRVKGCLMQVELWRRLVWFRSPCQEVRALLWKRYGVSKGSRETVRSTQELARLIHVVDDFALACCGERGG